MLKDNNRGLLHVIYEGSAEETLHKIELMQLIYINKMSLKKFELFVEF